MGRLKAGQVELPEVQIPTPTADSGKVTIVGLEGSDKSTAVYDILSSLYDDG